MFTLKLYLMGLIGLVRIGDGVVFVLPAHGDHVPILVCDPTTACQVESDQWSDVQRKLNVKEVDPPPIALLLDGETLQLVGAKPGPLVEPPDESFGILASLLGSCPYDQEEARSLSWLPELQEIEREAATIDPKHIFQPSEDKVAAVMSLFFEGEIEAFRFPYLETYDGNGEYKGRSVHSLTFKEEGQKGVIWTRRHAAPDVLEVVLEDVSDVSIHLRPFDPTKRGRTLKITGEAIVLLGNLTPLPEEYHFEQKVGDPLRHFEHYYGLSRTPIDVEELKVPHIGSRHVDDCRVNPKDLPRVLTLVSTSEKELKPPARSPSGGHKKLKSVIVSGVERPICTFAEYILP